MFGRLHVRATILAATVALAAAGCGGVTGVDDQVIVTPPPPPGGPGDSIGAPVAMRLVSGDSQSVLVNQFTPQRLVVQLVDSAGMPVKGQAVTWTATDSGLVTPLSLVTDDNGEASASWQFGRTPGAQYATATAGDFKSNFQGSATLSYSTVDAGGFHACGITPAAAVYCWGYNGDGQLGDSTHTNRNVPVPMASNLTFRQLSGGRYHTCGVTLAGIAYCWGANVDGRLGDNSQEPSAVPVQTATPATFSMVGSGRLHACALSLSGIVYCWGFNQEGEVGAKIPPADSVVVKVPRPVSAQSFKTLGVGGLHSCAIDLDDQVWCWGFNGYGQLGDGTTMWTLNNTPFGGLPVAVQRPAGVSGFQSVTAGLYHSCALANGQAFCWGDNRYGQLGNGSTTGSLVPVAVAMPAGVSFTSISAGDTHTCAVATDGQAYCWGDNSGGKFGDGTSMSTTTPVTVAAGLQFVSYSAGETLSCGVTTAGKVYCAGSNEYGQLGDASNQDHATPVKGAYQP